MTDSGENFSRAALPHDLESYRKEASDITMAAFEQKRPYPFLLYARSKLWDPALLGGANVTGEQTMLVDYNVISGGMTFVSPIRKVQSSKVSPDILLGRSTSGNDLVVPVSSVSSTHAKFLPPGPGGKWTITDLGSRNGTYVNEDQMKAHQTLELDDGIYLRLGGNLIAWFLYPGRLWKLLHDDEDLAKLTDL